MLTDKQNKALEDISLIEKIDKDSNLVVFKHIKENKEDFNELNSKIDEVEKTLEQGMRDIELFEPDDGLKGETGDKGEKGESIIGKDGRTPIKGKDYFDGKDGRTPLKGVDYFDGADGEDADEKQIIRELTKKIPEPIKGDKGDTPNHKWKGTKLAFEKPDGKFGKFVDLKGKDGGGLSFFNNGSGGLWRKTGDYLIPKETNENVKVDGTFKRNGGLIEKITEVNTDNYTILSSDYLLLVT